MPEFTYTGSDVRTYYPPGQPAFEVVPGEAYQLKADPGDGRWRQKRKSAASQKKATAKKSALKSDPTPAPAGQSKE